MLQVSWGLLEIRCQLDEARGGGGDGDHQAGRLQPVTADVWDGHMEDGGAFLGHLQLLVDVEAPLAGGESDEHGRF